MSNQVSDEMSAFFAQENEKKRHYNNQTIESNLNQNNLFSSEEGNHGGVGTTTTTNNNNNNLNNLQMQIKKLPRQNGFCFLFCAYIYQNLASVTIVILLTIIFALAGERASSKGEDAEYVEDKITATNIMYRPCQVYTPLPKDEVLRDFRVLQTSLNDPSVHWGQIPCLVRNSSKSGRKDGNNNNNNGLDSGWSWLLGSDVPSKELLDPIEYGMPSAEVTVNTENRVNPEREPILGFGGAFTEASALNFMNLQEDGRQAVLELLFGKKGLGYSLGRVHMNSCDFCVKSYSFDDTDGDFDLIHFDEDVQHDVSSGMIEFMKRANDISKTDWAEEGDHGMRIVASPWSPPAWMKKPTYEDPPDSLHATTMLFSAEPNCLREGTGPDSNYAKSWALYFSKFITAYKKQGVHLFGVTIQNEPEFPAPWEACAYNKWNEGSFLNDHLGPQLRKEHPDVKIFIFDHNKDHAPAWANTILNQTNPASRFVDGTAVHWYAGGMDRLLDGAVGQPNMHRLVSEVKDLTANNNHLILGSEACHCPTTGYAGGDLNVAWARAERYAHTVLADLAAGSNGWVEWNLILDAIGGPNHLGNLCDSPLLSVPYRIGGKDNITVLPDFEHTGLKFGPVIGDTRTREELNAIGIPSEYLDLGVVVQPMFYYMGHISRHVRPGSSAVSALVDNVEQIGQHERLFLHTNTNGIPTMGGGINNLARKGVEVTTWPCEGSTRQSWKLNEIGQLQVSGHDWLGKPTSSCLSKKPDKSFEGLLLNECDTNAGTIQLNDLGDNVNFSFENSNNSESNSCLIIKPLRNNGGAYGPRGGAQAVIGDCSDSSAKWKFNRTTGEISSSFFAPHGGEVCLTTGWPFLQVGTFLTPNANNNKTAVILNEAAEPANYVFRDQGEILLTNSIPAHSIQTVLFN